MAIFPQSSPPFLSPTVTLEDSSFSHLLFVQPNHLLSVSLHAFSPFQAPFASILLLFALFPFKIRPDLQYPMVLVFVFL
jgi:hypothetical protein